MVTVAPSAAMLSKRGLVEPLGMCTTAFWPSLLAAPCHAATMVAVGGGKEGSLAKVLGQLIGGQVIEGAVGNVLAGLVGNIAGHGKRTAQNLKGVEAKAIALVLNAQVDRPKRPDRPAGKRVTVY